MKWPEEKNNLARRFRISFSSRKKKGTVQSKGLTDRIVGITGQSLPVLRVSRAGALR